LEVIKSAVLGGLIWDFIKIAGFEIFRKAKEKVVENVLKELKEKIPLKDKDIEILKSAVLNYEGDIEDKESFVKYIEQIINERENINIKVEKGIGYIGKNEGNITMNF